jgi:hypothetical protein
MTSYPHGLAALISVAAIGLAIAPPAAQAAPAEATAMADFFTGNAVLFDLKPGR